MLRGYIKLNAIIGAEVNKIEDNKYLIKIEDDHIQMTEKGDLIMPIVAFPCNNGKYEYIIKQKRLKEDEKNDLITGGFFK